MRAFVGYIDLINSWIGRGVAWLTALMGLTALLVVILRYVFNIGHVWMQESYVWMHGIVFMVGAGYTLLHDQHVRVDLFYAKASETYKAWVNLLGVVFLLWPVTGMVGWASWPYVLDSWAKQETSYQADGLHGLFLLKTMLIVFCVLLALQGLSLVLRSVLVLRGEDERNNK